MYNDYEFVTQDVFQGIELVAQQLFTKRAELIGPPSYEKEGDQIAIDNVESLSKKTLAM